MRALVSAREGNVKAQHIADRQQLVQRHRAHDPCRQRVIGWQHRVEDSHLHADRGRDACDALADLTESHDAESPALELKAILRARPSAGADFAVHPRDLARGGAHEGDCQLGHRLRVGTRRDVDRNAALRACADVDVADADAVL